MVEQYYVIAWSSSLRIFKCVLVRVQSRCRQVRVAHALLCGHACTNTEVTCHIRLYLGMITGVHFFLYPWTRSLKSKTSGSRKEIYINWRVGPLLMHLPVLALLLCLDVLYARSANSKLLRDLEMMPS